MKRILISVILGAAFIIGCAAGGGNAMVGTWEMELSDKAKTMMAEAEKMGAPKTDPPKVSMEFKGDGTWTGSFKFGTQSSTASGTYTLEGKTLSLTTSMEDGKAKTDAKAETVTLADDMKSFAPPKAEEMGKMVKK